MPIFFSLSRIRANIQRSILLHHARFSQKVTHDTRERFRIFFVRAVTGVFHDDEFRQRRRRLLQLREEEEEEEEEEA